MKQKTKGKVKTKPTIFVSIASYRDPELIPTLLDMIKEAKHPERLRIGVCWQDDENTQPFLDAGMTLVDSLQHEGVPVFYFQYQKAAIELLSFHYFASQGACWARHSVELHYKQEDYFLQIDSHCRFVPHWDTEMITMLEGLRGQSKYPVLSSYPPGYTPGNDEARTKYVSRLIFRGFNNEKILGLSSTPFESTTPRRCGYLAAGFVFADGHFVTKVPNDPQIFFLGEEIAMAARAFTHGYDMWSPSHILLWHFYSRKDHPKVWGDHNNQAKKEGAVDKAWWERDKTSKMRVLSVLNASDDECDLGPYRLGNVRSLQEFQYRIGVDFREQKVHPDVFSTEKINWFDELPTDHNQWLLQLRCINEKLLQIPKEELDLTRTDIAWWHVGVYSTQNTPLMVKQYTPEEMRKQLRDVDEKMVELNIRFITINHSPVNNIRICPYSTQEGWGQVVEKPW
ncbi:GlcNAc-transferase family protein [Serratia sp. UGAL515B_01]|uniref:GlcNAc-transferase family protein n=1 Tax=Serratia sp. UGAL515B_01 TaxID=2986763 RepID=UPI002953E315|nr:GlcNAc-transferase family protein [Serratia sp. UGAL515B_01]WON77473.1 UDP-N-acetylglucosamine-transferase [Serratia sp. UGAL515B_01]